MDTTASPTQTTLQPTPAIRVTGLGKSYGKTLALAAVDFTLHRGQWTVLLGENGAGKSTLIQLLCGLFSPDEGHIEIAGMDLTDQPCDALARLGVVFQQPTLDMDLSVKDNLMYHAGLHGLRADLAVQRMDEGLARAGLESLKNTMVRSLSGGQRRRVELVRALMHRPGVLLMDEATVGLDPGSRQQLLELVRSLVRDEGLCVLWTTHWAQEVVHADQLLVLQKGRLSFANTPQVLLQQTGQADLEQAFLHHTQNAPA